MKRELLSEVEKIMLEKNRKTIIQISECLGKTIHLNDFDSRGEYISNSVIQGTPNTEYSGLTLYNCIVKHETKFEGDFDNTFF